MPRRYHVDGSLPDGDGWVFVFGSNLAGRHGAGAALVAARQFGARRGQAEGVQGRAYGIPTKDASLRVLDLEAIAAGAQRLIEFSSTRVELQFFVTRVGCGLAGYEDWQIAPMFRQAGANFSFPRAWKRWLEPGP